MSHGNSTSQAVFSGRYTHIAANLSHSPHFRPATFSSLLGPQRHAVNELQLRVRAGGGVLARSGNLDIAGSIDRARRERRIISLAPGVYCLTGLEDDPWVRLRAAALWAGPNAIFTGLAAAKLSFWESCTLGEITLAVCGHHARSRRGLTVEQRQISIRCTVTCQGLRLTSPALTAVDLAATELGGDVIDRVLRMRMATLDDMWAAWRAHPHRSGNKVRAELLQDSRDLPWSEAERLQHRLLRAARIVGWKANQWISCSSAGYYVDILFKRHRLIVEIDGWETHGTRLAFEEDRRRRNRLVLAGYAVLNFTYRQLVDEPEWVIACIRSALR
jgi:very-short-patch-repair endonuclease